ncbi:aminopeptidase P family protein [bacterium]|nr:aminopeptidase P family protein [bacterium]
MFRSGLVCLFVCVTSVALSGLSDDLPEIGHEKILNQRVNHLLPEIMRQQNVDMWLVFTRENTQDPILATIGVEKIVARGAFIFSRKNGAFQKIAIAASYDVSPIEDTGLYDQVIAYKNEGVKVHLKEWVAKLDPNKIAINYSRDVTVADGLTFGMRSYLQEAIGEKYRSRLISSERLVVSLLGKKLPMEIRALRTAVLTTKQIIKEVLTPERIEIGVTTERDLGEFMSKRTRDLGMEVAFLSIVVGPVRGHSEPTDRVIQPGDLIRIDFGVRYQGYAADIQRTAYVLKAREDNPPDEIERLWQVALKSNQASVAAMKPGVTGNDVDKAGREIILDSGFDGYPHAAGHAIGLKVHDVGAILGPDWPERYGNTVFFPLEVNQVYAVEPILYAEDPRTGEQIHIALEEDVIITQDGVEHIGPPQTELIVIDCGC